ncbi:sigma-70 family RNA polymerase sigma factor [Rhizobium sp. NTR19]|uniref:Sigma-70 family RNA polymerase sigma factor n=1 Tax=Neorhizobium turbinariae TaxID=2937795 RepID=A0ABT0IQZ5_9HYPH|nr:sigma-70 family RNA polymerase sigma factor [Neorhizobium turbinariae]MCK8780302.1 sigma-70 family RNA polymerase sigma factor [Neorhizobium turbinariae]
MSLGTDTDIAALIGRVALRDRAALSSLYAAASPKLFAVCLRILKDRSDAEDALQEVFVKIWHRADQFALSTTSPAGWLVTIARNHSIDVLRARKPVADNIEDNFDLADTARDPEAETVLKGEGKRIDRCMEELDSDRAVAVRSAYVEGLSYQELADRFNVPLNTMRTWLRRSLLKLRECLDR